MAQHNCCCICLESIIGGSVGVTSCGHCFHTDCYKPWRTKSSRCPTCNATVSLFHPLYLDFAAIGNDDDELSIDSESEGDSAGIKEGQENSDAEASSKKRKQAYAVEGEEIVVIDDEVAIVEKKRPVIDPAAVSTKKCSKYKGFIKRQRATISSLQTYVDTLKESNEKDSDTINCLRAEKACFLEKLECIEEKATQYERDNRQQEALIGTMELELQNLQTAKARLTLEVNQLKVQRRKESSTEMTEVKRFMVERPKLMAELKMLREQQTLQQQSSQHKAGICQKQKRQMLKSLDKTCEQQKVSAPKWKKPSKLDTSKYASRSLQLVNNGCDRTKQPKPAATNPLSSLLHAPKRSMAFNMRR